MSAANSATRRALELEAYGGAGLFAAIGGAGFGDLFGVEAAGADG